jgi:hypothetical protein
MLVSCKEDEMFAWMSTIEWDPQRMDEAVRHFREHRLPEIQKAAGFKKAFLMTDRHKGQMVVLNLFETEKDAQAFAEGRKKALSKGQGPQEAGGSKPLNSAIMEIAIQAEK